MNIFIRRCIWFSVPIVVFIVLGLLLPVTPKSSKSLLFANKQKDQLLVNVASPRMIFVGGSNLSFGLNSKTIKNELNVNPINTGVHASIGVKYMLDNTVQYVKEGDVVILALEYGHFYRDYNHVSEELFRTIVDVDLKKIKLLNLQQIVKFIPYVFKYSFSKFRLSEYFNIKESDVYSVNSFNEYGDTYKHWDLEARNFPPAKELSGKYNQSVIDHILEFQKDISKRKAVLYVTYPGFQDLSYSNSVKQIEKITIEYKKHNLEILGSPERYRIPNNMMFNTPYHLNKTGVDFRTSLFIQDYKTRNLDSEKLYSGI